MVKRKERQSVKPPNFRLSGAFRGTAYACGTPQLRGLWTIQQST
jgi:hypothetical protein